ncbi:retron St85 family effector protein (plasmid) [Agrobacterium sp. rho-8.1]|nr:retron St85 family effector protein [Agrobacterium sp. rho-8.1]
MVYRFEAKSLHVRAPSPIILLCGGPIDVKTPKPVSLREAYTLVYGRTTLRDYANVTPEEFKIFAPDGNYQDWLSFESEFAQIVDLIILFSESYGSVAELGAFAMVEEIALRLLVVMDDKNYADPSFVKLGPVRRLETKYGKSAVCVLNRQDINISDITKVADVNLDKFAATLVAAITRRKSDYKERTTFIPDRTGHLIKLIVGLIQHYGALTETEIEVLLFAMDLKVRPEKIPDYLLCAVNANWILKDKRGVEEYFCALPNTGPAIEYKLRKDLPVEEKDRERWRARVIEHWKTTDADRFSSIQAALKKAL